jgi:hypothetical protein
MELSTRQDSSKGVGHQFTCRFSGGPVQSHRLVGLCFIEGNDENQLWNHKVLGYADRMFFCSRRSVGEEVGKIKHEWQGIRLLRLKT